MDNEKLIKANELKENIKRVLVILDQWTGTQKLVNDQIFIVDTSDNQRHAYVPVSPETFTIIKALNVAYFTDLLAKLKKEFEEL